MVFLVAHNGDKQQRGSIPGSEAINSSDGNFTQQQLQFQQQQVLEKYSVKVSHSVKWPELVGRSGLLQRKCARHLVKIIAHLGDYCCFSSCALGMPPAMMLRLGVHSLAVCLAHRNIDCTVPEATTLSLFSCCCSAITQRSVPLATMTSQACWWLQETAAESAAAATVHLAATAAAAVAAPQQHRQLHLRRRV